MSKSRRAYAPEFRRQLVELVHAGRTPEELAREFEPTLPRSNASCSRAAGSRRRPRRAMRRLVHRTAPPPFLDRIPLTNRL